MGNQIEVGAFKILFYKKLEEIGAGFCVPLACLKRHIHSKSYRNFYSQIVKIIHAKYQF
jgi:hypothetical protein